MALLALVLLATGGAGLWAMRGGEEVAKGDGSLIAAPAAPYKVRPAEAGGMTVEGQGDASFAASEGIETSAAIDFGAAPEAPVAGTRAAPDPRKATKGSPSVEATIRDAADGPGAARASSPAGTE